MNRFGRLGKILKMGCLSAGNKFVKNDLTRFLFLFTMPRGIARFFRGFTGRFFCSGETRLGWRRGSNWKQ